MKKRVKNCHNCAWCPVFFWQDMPNPQYSCWRGRCRFPTDAKTMRKLKLPQGAQLSPSWIERDKPKKNCPAWAQK